MECVSKSIIGLIEFRKYLKKSRGGVAKVLRRKGELFEKGGVLLKIGGFCGKMVVFSENGVFVGFWSRIQGKVGKSREFDDFWKIGKNREK